jgi:hypothetical protein
MLGSRPALDYFISYDGGRKEVIDVQVSTNLAAAALPYVSANG